MSRALLASSILLATAALRCDEPSAEATAPAPPPTLAAKALAAPAIAPSVARIASANIDPAGKSVADRVAKAYVEALRSGSFADGADVSHELKKVTPAEWQAVLGQTTAKYGAEKSMDFADAWSDPKGGTMYRYRASFAKAERVEFRVDLNGENVATKFGTYDWTDGAP